MNFVRVRCPAPDCRDEFDLPPDRLGRNVYCLTCGVRMTARPAVVSDRLAEIAAARPRGGSPSPSVLPLVLLVDNVRSLWNVGSIFRTADAFGVREVVLAGISAHPPREQISKTALGAEQVVAWRYHPDALSALREVEAEGYTAVALEDTPRARSIDEIEWPARCCIVIGNEVSGVSPEVLDACSRHARIPMRGVKESLNVAVALGVAAHMAASALDLQETR